MVLDDLIQAEELPSRESQPDVAEPAAVSPADRTQSDAHDIGVIRNPNLIVIGEEPELLGISLAVVDDHGPLLTALLIMIPLAQIGNDMLTRSGLGTYTFDQYIVDVGFAVLLAYRAAQEHAGLLSTTMTQGRHKIKVQTLKEVFTTTI
jgi:hypothetical protein